MQCIPYFRGLAVLAVLSLGACDTSRNPAAPDAQASSPARSLGGASPTVTNSGGNPLVSWSAIPEATSYTVYLNTYSWINGGYGASQELVGTTTGTSLLDTLRDYTGCSHWSVQFGNDTYEYLMEYQVLAHSPSGTSSVHGPAPVGSTYGCLN